MLDSQKYTSAGADNPDAPGSAPSADAPVAQAVAAEEEFLTVTGAAWAEYHLLLGDSSPQATRIEREIRTFGGAPTMAVLLARWCAEEQSTAHLRVQLVLTLGRDPNARLMRRELESWAARLPNLGLYFQEDEAAPEVAYRILMWPQHDAGEAASTWGAPQVLQCGEIEERYEIRRASRVSSLSGSDVGCAACAWVSLGGSRDEFGRALGNPKEVRLERLIRSDELEEAAQRCWNAKPVLERIACNLSWREIEAEAADEAEAEALEKI